jgi:hypothetical protein
VGFSHARQLQGSVDPKPVTGEADIDLDPTQPTQLVQSGDLDPEIVAEMPTLTFGAQIEWTQALGMHKPVYATIKNECGTYRCLLDPTSCP